MFLYLDSSALVKRYVDEPHSEEVAHLMDETLAIGTSAISRVEVGAALARADCGADCSGSKNPCGGDHYWELEIVSPINLVTALEEEECKPDAVGMPGDVPGRIRRRSGGLYRATGRWNFHGVYANICAEHDVACRTSSLPGPWYMQLVNPLYIGYCLIGGALSGALICLDSTMPYVWKYEEQIFGYKFGPWSSTGESCTVFGGSGI